MKKLKRLVLKEELFELCDRNFNEAVVLNQLIFWQGIINDSDQDILNRIESNKKLGLETDKLEKKLRHGWFWKTAKELSDEIMNIKSERTINRVIIDLEKKGFIEKEPHARGMWDKTNKYKVDLNHIQSELEKIGFNLEGYSKTATEQRRQNGGGERQNGGGERQNGGGERQNGGTVTVSSLHYSTSLNNSLSIYLSNDSKLPVIIQKRLLKRDMIDRLILFSNKFSVNIEKHLQDIEDLYADFKDNLTNEQFNSCLVDCLNADIARNVKEYIRSSLNKKCELIQAKVSKAQNEPKTSEIVPDWFNNRKLKERKESLVTDKPIDDILADFKKRKVSNQ